MKKNEIILMTLAVLAMVSLISFKPVKDDAPGPKATAMIADWERAKAYTMEYLNAATDDAIAFKPTPEMRSFGQQMLHLSEANYGIGSAASAKKNPSRSDSWKKLWISINPKKPLPRL